MLLTENQQESVRTVPEVALNKVLHLINGEHFSGAERVQDLLAMSLPEFGYQADFACLKTGKFPKVRQSESKLFEINMKNSWDLFCYREILKLVESGDYKILHAHTPRSLMVGALAKRHLSIPLVYHVHSPVGRDSTRSIQNQVNTWVEKLSLKMVDKMICVSGSLANYMQELGHDLRKICIVNNGVPANDDFSEKRLPGPRWTLGTMALFRPRKGIEILLQAMSLLKKQGVDVDIRAVGPFETQEYEEEIKSLVKELDIEDRIHWTGFQKDVNAELQQMDLFVLPSLFGEGLPMVVLEAMALGVPVIASHVEGIPEAVRHGIDGLIFEPGNPADLAEKVESIFGDQQTWSLMSASSLERQREHLSDTTMASGVAEVYDSL